jgi:hypothetical protein
MKKTLLLLVGFLPAGPLMAQWTTSGTLNLNNLFTGGKVAIGTSTAPVSMLDVYTNLPSQATYTTQQWITSNANYNLRLATVWDANGISQRFVQKANLIFLAAVLLQQILFSLQTTLMYSGGV